LKKKKLDVFTKGFIKKTPSLAYLQERNALMKKTNYSVARVVTYTKQ